MTTNSSSSKFQFEDFDKPEKHHRASEEKLSTLFPPGSDLEELKELLVNSGAKCFKGSESTDAKTVCRYEKTPSGYGHDIIMSVWIVTVMHKDYKIENIQVQTGLIGP